MKKKEKKLLIQKLKTEIRMQTAIFEKENNYTMSQAAFHIIAFAYRCAYDAAKFSEIGFGNKREIEKSLSDSAYGYDVNKKFFGDSRVAAIVAYWNMLISLQPFEDNYNGVIPLTDSYEMGIVVSKENPFDDIQTFNASKNRIENSYCQTGIETLAEIKKRIKKSGLNALKDTDILIADSDPVMCAVAAFQISASLMSSRVKFKSFKVFNFDTTFDEPFEHGDHRAMFAIDGGKV
ncbi:hypothetical protein KPA96_13630 [Burkholderia cenocepacia]|uniref:hypothetical protein n=1 Tax=Burkholderia cenocepacia TaxID=95486 RepID=UPI002854311A|nr:hypothetical protein [Burkholderia cenocepacia]MDR8076697.1 hypothetical protein [Burkholderia cenocepacia]